jgi:hypothetical protein
MFIKKEMRFQTKNSFTISSFIELFYLLDFLSSCFTPSTIFSLFSFQYKIVLHSNRIKNTMYIISHFYAMNMQMQINNSNLIISF